VKITINTLQICSTGKDRQTKHHSVAADIKALCPTCAGAMLLKLLNVRQGHSIFNTKAVA